MCLSIFRRRPSLDGASPVVECPSVRGLTRWDTQPLGLAPTTVGLWF